MTAPVLVVGVGNALRGDDAAGLLAAQRIRGMGLANVEVAEHTGDGAALMELWRGREAVVLIDAASSGPKRPALVPLAACPPGPASVPLAPCPPVLDAPAPGTIHRFDAARQAVPAEFFRYSTHAFGVAEAVELARTLGELPPTVILYGIEGDDYRAGAPMTAAVADAVIRAAERAADDIRDLSR